MVNARRIMDIAGAALGLRDGSPEDPRYPLTSSVLLDWLNGAGATESGVAVNEHKAMQMSAVYRSIALIGGTSASLPLHAYTKGENRKRVDHKLVDDPHPDLTWYDFRELQFVHLIGWGNCYAQKMRNSQGDVIELWPIRPERVKPGRASDGTKVYEVTNDAGVKEGFTDREIFHVPGLGFDGIAGVSVIQCARQAIGMGLAAEEFGARFFANGSMLSGILSTDQKLKQEQADTLKKRWQEKIGGLKKSHQVAVLDAGAKFQPVSIPARDAQFIESRRFQVAEIARWFGVPPHMLADVERSTSWGSGIEYQGIQFLIYTLRPWLTRYEQRVTKALLPRTTYAEFMVEDLLRVDTKSRYEAYGVGRQWGWLATNDVRRKENMTEVEGGDDDFLMPTNMMVRGEPLPEPEQQQLQVDPPGDT